MRLHTYVAFLFVTTASFEALASNDSPAACKKWLEDNGHPAEATSAKPCEVVGTILYGDVFAEKALALAKDAKDGISVADVQPNPVLGGIHNSLGQASPVPSPLPTPLAGVTAAAVGTETGAKLVTEIKLNPLALLYADKVEETSWASRTADAVLILPASTDGPLEKLEYFGFHVRFNAFGFKNGAQALKNLRESYDKLAAASTKFNEALVVTIKEAEDTTKCITALSKQDSSPASIQEACGRHVDFDSFLPAQQDFHDATEEARRDADRRYLGLDLRGDFGDPRFTGRDEQRGTRLLASVAAGQRLGDGAQYAQLRGRLGAAYTHLRDTDKTNYALDWGLGLEFGSETDARTTKGSVGLEGRAGGFDTGTGDTKYMDLLLGVTVPFSVGSGISIGLAIPMVQPRDAGRKPTLSISGDWELLLGQRK